MILTVAGVVLVPSTIHAAPSILEGPMVSVVNSLIATVANWVLGLTSTLVIFSGIFLSISINLTTHIGSFFNSIPALNDVWVVVRNISSIFIIFVLLYSSIKTILGIGGTDIKSLVGKIIMAGLLINFSLFFVKLSIDASNLISLQFYSAIAPNTSENFSTGKVMTDGGLSNVFMSSLGIPKIYQNQGVLKSTDVALSIGFATIGGVIMMITAAISFLAAAIAFTVRTGLLMFIMALSPIFFAGMIFPQIKTELSDRLFKLLKNQLIFMPAYLILMYIALKLISSPGFTAIFNQSANGVAPAGEAAIGPTFIGVIIQYVIALLFINAPLVFAIQMGAIGAKWAPTVGGISKWVGKNTWRNTGGRVASKVAENEKFKDIASNYKVGEWALKGTRGVAANYNEKLNKQVSARTKFGESLGHDQGAMNTSQAYLRSLNAQLAQAQATGTPTANIKTAIGNVKQAITNLENRRKSQFASRIDTHSVDTLYTKVARKDKVAAAKLQIPIVQDQVNKYKEDLKDTKAEIKQLQNAITNNPGGVGATGTQSARLTQLFADQTTHTNNINTQEALLDNLKLVK